MLIKNTKTTSVSTDDNTAANYALDELRILSKNLADLSNVEFPTEGNPRELLEAVRRYEAQSKSERDVQENKREKTNDRMKEVGSYIQIKQNDLNE